MSKRIGLTMRVDRDPHHEEWRDGLDQAWWGLLAAALPGWLAVPLPNAGPATLELARGLKLDGLIFSGGNDLGTRLERDTTELALLDYALAQGVPVLGVCRGMQLIVRHFGGDLERVAGHVAVSHAVQVVQPTLNLPEGALPVNSYHTWGVARAALPDRLQAWAFDGQGRVEALAGPGCQAIMWHPERPLPDARAGASLVRSYFLSER